MTAVERLGERRRVRLKMVRNAAREKTKSRNFPFDNIVDTKWAENNGSKGLQPSE